MSHFSVTVAVAAEDAEQATEGINALLSPFNEGLFVAQRIDEGGDVYWHNPRAQWDWYQIGGRWSGDLPLRTDAPAADILTGKRSWTNEDEPVDPTRCDGGRIRALDLARERDEAAAKAGTDWDEYAGVVRGTPQHLPWSMFSDRVEQAVKSAPRPKSELEREALERVLADFDLADMDAADALQKSNPTRFQDFLERSTKELQAVDAQWQASVYTLEKAQAEYAAQPRIAALRNHAPYKKRGLFWDPEDIFDHLSRDEFVALQRAKAIPGFATLTHDGRWLQQGEMGWFGLSTKTDESVNAYVTDANAYLDGLAPDMWLAIVDCHI
jgi:hypothetical protein